MPLLILQPDFCSGLRKGSSQSQLLTQLRSPSAGPTWALAWQPDGRLLATGGPQRPGCAVWDVAVQKEQLVAAGAT